MPVYVGAMNYTLEEKEIVRCSNHAVTMSVTRELRGGARGAIVVLWCSYQNPLQLLDVFN